MEAWGGVAPCRAILPLSPTALRKPELGLCCFLIHFLLLWFPRKQGQSQDEEEPQTPLGGDLEPFLESWTVYEQPWDKSVWYYWANLNEGLEITKKLCWKLEARKEGIDRWLSSSWACHSPGQTGFPEAPIQSIRPEAQSTHRQADGLCGQWHSWKVQDGPMSGSLSL